MQDQVISTAHKFEASAKSGLCAELERGFVGLTALGKSTAVYSCVFHSEM